MDVLIVRISLTFKALLPLLPAIRRCPTDENPLCAQNGLSGINQYGANVNFDLCSDSGAEAAFFDNDINKGIGLAVGTAIEGSLTLRTSSPF